MEVLLWKGAWCAGVVVGGCMVRRCCRGRVHGVEVLLWEGAWCGGIFVLDA